MQRRRPGHRKRSSVRSSWKNNQAKAEEIYRSTIEKNPTSAGAHRGLGMLYEDQDRFEDAAREFRKYLELAPPDAADRLRIEGRIKKLMERPR